LLTYGEASYTYTAAGELRTKTVAGQATQYTSDALGNLTAVALPGGKQLEYVVDGRNRRVGKRVNGALVRGFLYAGQLAPVAELDGAGQVVSRFVYGTRVNVPEYMEKGGARYRLITDYLGSVRLVVNASTGAVSQRLDYDEFGRVTRNTAPGFQPFGFAGGMYDEDTHLTRFGARDYDAVTGRWTAKDPIGFAGGDPNVYAYVKLNPVNSVDPLGLCILSSGPGDGSGCGDKGSDRYVPDEILNADYSAACTRHDECYARPGSVKLACDIRLGLDVAVASVQGSMPLLAASVIGGVFGGAVAGLGYPAYRTAQSMSQLGNSSTHPPTAIQVLATPSGHRVEYVPLDRLF
jgi:RHS repeat-associated protein